MAAPSTLRRSLRWTLVFVVLVFVGVAGLNALGAFEEPKPYRTVHHPTHDHYIPNECGDNVQASNFPTRPPAEGERITCDGTVISP